ncbi:hypothetical protein Lal_00032835 [Lupinus albus]|nr:hypothetical protein Lal_00032835 [Lupinus albus]
MNITYPGFFFLMLFDAFYLSSLAFGATLSKDEVKALKDIANKLGKKDWDFSIDPCSEEAEENSITCNCSFANGTICHVTNIYMKEQNLPGTLPPELVRLPFLQEIDLSRNYLSGSIPKEWGSTKLVNISLLGNRITDSIPREIANISTLRSL